ncbi:MAG: glucosamine-6-phosphate deaminase [Candidatus Levybacteria bacterium]|nr:glucosamine-6-phosphate deaminase [Candidatus Levybacteria bacterium]
MLWRRSHEREASQFLEGPPVTYPLEVVVLPTPEDVDTYAANAVIAQQKMKPKSVYIMPTGSTPKGFYQRIVDACKKRQVSFRKATIFNLDEYWKIDPWHPDSYASYMRVNLIDHIDIKAKNWHIPNGNTDNPIAEAKRYEALLNKHQPIDLAILGIGMNGHIGFNEPGTAVDAPTSFVKLHQSTIERNSDQLVASNETKLHALTIGPAEILKADRIMLLAKGIDKADAVNRAIRGQETSQLPASYLRRNKKVTFVLDEAAALYLPKTIRGTHSSRREEQRYSQVQFGYSV